VHAIACGRIGTLKWRESDEKEMTLAVAGNSRAEGVA
jgi:hypothetical protein